MSRPSKKCRCNHLKGSNVVRLNSNNSMCLSRGLHFISKLLYWFNRFREVDNHHVTCFILCIFCNLLKGLNWWLYQIKYWQICYRLSFAGYVCIVNYIAITEVSDFHNGGNKILWILIINKCFEGKERAGYLLVLTHLNLRIIIFFRCRLAESEDLLKNFCLFLYEIDWFEFFSVGFEAVIVVRRIDFVSEIKFFILHSCQLLTNLNVNY